MSYIRFLCLFAYSGVRHILTIGVAWLVSYKRYEFLGLCGRLGSLPVLFGFVLLVVFVVCVMILFCLPSFFVSTTLPVSVDYPFVIITSDSSNVCFLQFFA